MRIDDPLERANVITHVPGIFMGLSGLIMLDHLSWPIVIFCLTIILMFSASSIYHWVRVGKSKRLWRVADHVSIYCLIAGTYTAFVMTYLNNSEGHLILKVLWICVLLGSILKIFFTGRFRLLSTIIYLIMGWVGIFSFDRFVDSIPADILILIGVGGLFYSVGTIFYLWKKWPYHHAIWHVFVLIGAMAHWIGVFMPIIWRQ